MHDRACSSRRGIAAACRRAVRPQSSLPLALVASWPDLSCTLTLSPRLQEELKKATAEIASFPPLVFAGECRTLQARLAKCATGEAFILQVHVWRASDQPS